MNELTTLQPAESGIPLSANQLKARLAVIQSVMRDVMKKDTDYGVIPGTDKPSLFKPGAEKLCVTFRLSADTPEIEAVPDYAGDIRYRVRVPVRAADGTILAVGVGECSTGEEKYRWRRPVHQNEYDNAADDQRRQKFQRSGEVWNQVRVNPSDVANTVLKMAHKRAYVHAVIMATAAGAIFTQDIEDLPDGVAQAEGAKPAQPQAQRAEKPKPAAGAGSVATVKVKDITKKEGVGSSGPYTKWTVIATDGQKYGTFDAEIHRIAREAWEAGESLEVRFTSGQYGRDIQTLAVMAQAEPGANG